MRKQFAIVLLVLSTCARNNGQTTGLPAESRQSREPAGYPDFEIVESTPVGTILANPDIRNAHEVWLDMVGNAKKSIDAEEFYVSNQAGEPLGDVIAGIIAAARRGVSVRMIVDAGMYRTYPETVDSLGRQKNITTRVIDFRRLAGGIQHSKYFIVDGEEIFFGSQNFDWRALKHIHELGIRLRNKEAIQVYRDIFELDWKLSEKNEPSLIKEALMPKSYSVPIRMVEGPGDTLAFIPTASPRSLIPDTTLWDETNIVKLIDAAHSDVMLQFLTYSSLTKGGSMYTVFNDALLRAAHRGVKVRLIVSDWEKYHAEVEQLKKLALIPNIEVKFSSIPDLPGEYIPFARVEHCKYIVVDSSSCWLGTSNAEKSYFYNTRNVGVVVFNSKIAGILRRVFLKGWNGPYTELIQQEVEYKPREHGER
jgi:phosphatidylserine/phosphatidylglycerophosphate/cardiolipin synthase-like enzyme